MAKRDLLKMPDDFEGNMRALLATPPAPHDTAGSRKAAPKLALNTLALWLMLVGIIGGIIASRGMSLRALVHGAAVTCCGLHETRGIVNKTPRTLPVEPPR